MVTQSTRQPQLPEVSKELWLNLFKANWRQGEHITILGPTGTGKTTIALDVLEVRDWVCVVAVKRKDETLELFRKRGYQVIRRWPPDYTSKRVIYWFKPGSLTDDLNKQAVAIHEMLNKIYLAGGWALYLDEAGYIAGTLGLSRDVGVLLNQGRSAYLSVVVTMTRPSSVIARVPKESLNQSRHKLVFKFTDENEMKSCAVIVGMDWHLMQSIQQSLGKHDFLYIGENLMQVVRNTRRN